MLLVPQVFFAAKTSCAQSDLRVTLVTPSRQEKSPDGHAEVMTPTSIKFPPDMREKGERVAKAYGLSFNALMRMLLAKEIQRVRVVRRVKAAA